MLCHTPTPGKQPTRIPLWKYELLHDLILELVPGDEPGLPAKDLPELLRKRLDQPTLKRLGSVGWHATTVRLNMEVEGELKRTPRRTPLHLVRVG